MISKEDIMFINAKNSRAFNAKKTRQSPITKVISESHHINKSKEKNPYNHLNRWPMAIDQV